ncbi:L-histidine N(alpha)-methyltransferase [Luteimonas lutimaris]|uniref:L-histidine N(Alpha)-methyltransferase n=1 Tax=Luteimonas lutimaris TaxID=698645 RepID=A0ABP7M0U4_9GAMM
MSGTVALTDLHPSPDDIVGDVLAGLSQAPKRLPSKYFYDRRGSELFEQITRQPEYYLTRIELALLEASMGAIAAAVGPRAQVVEYGSGSGRKTRLLLDGLDDPVAYTPIEISRSALLASVERLDREFGDVEVLPVCADFTRPVPLPRPARAADHALVFFPGSTLGNFTDPEALRLLRAMRETMGERGGALVGIDLQKSPDVIEAAYNDAAGITAAFTLNLLARLNRDIGSDFDLGGFEHRAVYVRDAGRIETFLVSRRAQDVVVEGHRFHFAEGEAMQVEYSQKYTDTGFEALAAQAGLRVAHRWNDPDDWFGLRLLRRA